MALVSNYLNAAAYVFPPDWLMAIELAGNAADKVYVEANMP